MSQEELANLLGTSKQVISRYETAQRSPKVSTVSEYAEKLGVSISELTNDPLASVRSAFSSDSPAAKKLREIGRALAPASVESAEEQELIDIFRDLNETGQQTLLGTARGLSANPAMKKAGESNDALA